MNKLVIELLHFIRISNQNRNRNVKLHSPREIISTAGKTGARSKMEAETELKIIHPYQRQISINQDKRCTNMIFKASLFQFDFVLFKILQIKNISSRHFESVHLRHEWA